MNSKYVIFFCDECDLLNDMIGDFKQGYPLLSIITFEDREKLIDHLEKEEPPQLILVYITGPEKGYISFIKNIRLSINSSLIPVLICHELPSIIDVAKLLKQ